MFSEMKKKLGFGLMRLPMKGDMVDIEETNRMADAFIEAGFNYFDTARGYIDGQSEKAFKTCVSSRYPRDKYLIADKLSGHCFKQASDIPVFFESQLEACGVDYFDFYLMHAQSANNYGQYTSCNAYEISYELKAKGKIKHFGISFHDKPEFLEKILSDYPYIEFVQLQFNYMDYEDAAIESKACYDVCVKYGKPVIVMEPVKGGSLVNLPDTASAVFGALNGGSNASYAVRFAAGFENTAMVLSGMSNLSQMTDNINTMKDFVPLTPKETDAINTVCALVKARNDIGCTSCRYCIDGCPKKIKIPDIFACINAKKQFNDWNQDYYYSIVLTAGAGKASDCIGCKSCEKVCPQHLNICDLLASASNMFEELENEY